MILGLYWDNGKENGNYYNRIYLCIYFRVILGFYWDNGEEKGNYHNGAYMMRSLDGDSTKAKTPCFMVSRPRLWIARL